MAMKTIQNKVFLFSLLAVLIALLVVGGYCGWRFLMVEQYADDLPANLEAAYAAEGSSPWLIQEENNVSLLADETAAQYNQIFEELQSDVLSASAYMKKVLASPENFNGKALSLPDQGQEGVYSIRAVVASEGDETVPQYINELRILGNSDYIFYALFKANSKINTIYYTSESGASCVFTDDNQYPAYHDGREDDWYQKAAANIGQVVWLEPYTAADGDIVVSAAVNVEKPDGSIAGVVGANITVAALNGYLDGLDLGTNGAAFLIDPMGNLVTAAGQGANVLDGAEEDYQAALEALLGGEQGTAVVEIDGQQKIFGYVPLDNGFYLGLYRDVAELEAAGTAEETDLTKALGVVSGEIKDLVKNSFLFGGVLLGVVLLLVILFAYLIAKSIGNSAVPVTVTPKKAEKKIAEPKPEPEEPKKKKKKGREAAMEAIALAEAKEAFENTAIVPEVSVPAEETPAEPLPEEDADMQIVGSEEASSDDVQEEKEGAKPAVEQGEEPEAEKDQAEQEPEAKGAQSTLFLRRSTPEMPKDEETQE